MFLLSNIYREGLGVAPDRPGPPLLEEAAEHEYPPAMQELAHDRATGRCPESRKMSYAPATS
jgi:hypothetical protein